MTRFKKWLLKKGEQILNHYNEGPEPPERLREMVFMFAELHPHATRSEWVEFAADHAGECYRSGYMRGIEWTERDEERRVESGQPEAIMDAIEPDWRWSPEVMLHEPDRYVEEEPPPEEVSIKEQLAKLARR